LPTLSEPAGLADAPAAGGTAVEAIDVVKRYRLGELLSLKGTVRFLLSRDREAAKAATFEALSGVSFEARYGECYGLIGGNGSGKTTLLQLLAGITLPDSGRLVVGGRVLPLFEIGSGFHEELTGRENVILMGTILGLERAEILGAMDEIAAFAEVERHIDTPMKRYSLGMRARLSFATAMRFPADIYIFDEVLAVVDDAFTHKCLREMRALADAGACVLFVSHNMEVMRSLCERALWVDKGSLRAIGPVDDVAAEYLQDHAGE
jgi:homopolymeric O-antigen transport system ATP-binding protein